LKEIEGKIAYRTTQDKVVTLDRLLARVADWRSAKQVIVFTNGCFDVLHVGHIVLFEQCRTFGDKVIVAINSDSSVRKLKGPSRPFVAELQRARVLAALAVTDAVVVFSEPTPLELVLSIRPDVLVKGGDYSESTIVGAKEVRSWGGRVELVPTVEGFSTTGILNKISRETQS
jgi:D-beta-D-heptose 7-phosphate kinase / D-beta-D-heptose 1-phosphate adenosyltransferase